MLSQKPLNGMAKQKALKVIAATQQLASFCDAIYFGFRLPANPAPKLRHAAN
jgi:hypothetical protein